MKTHFKRRSERGYIGVTVLGLLVLLTGTSLIALGGAKSSVHTARKNAEFTESRQSMDEAFAKITFEMNRPGTIRNAVVSATPNPYVVDFDRAGANARGDSSWSFNKATGVLTVAGSVATTSEDLSRYLRGRYVGSYEDAGDVIAYGVTPGGPAIGGTYTRGAWGAVLAAAEEAAVAGTFQPNADGSFPDVAMYGAGNFTKQGTSLVNAVAYSNDVDWAGTYNLKARSSLTAYMDTNELSARVTDLSAAGCLPLTRDVLPACSVGSITVDSTTGSHIYGIPRTLSVRGGTVTIDADVANLVIYTSGSVKITGNRNLSNVFIYAPQGDCSASGSIAFTGSMSCKSLNLTNPANTFKHSNASPDTSSSTDFVLFAESAGYLDHLSK